MKLGNLAALHHDGADAVDAIQWRLQIIGRDLPELRGREKSLPPACVRRKRVAKDGKGREGQPVGGDLRCAGKRLLHLGKRRVRQLQRAIHVDVPVEEEADLGRAATGGAAYRLQAGNAVDRVLDRLGDGHLHLLDRHDTVIDADDDAGEIGVRKDGDRKLGRGIDSTQRKRRAEEEDRLGQLGKPERRIATVLMGEVVSITCRPSPCVILVTLVGLSSSAIPAEFRSSPWFRHPSHSRRS